MKKVVLAAIIVLLLGSCSAPIIRSGKADIEIALGGVIPQIRQDDIAYVVGTRAITPNTLTVRVTISGERYSKIITVPIHASTALLSGLPAYEPLKIVLEALDFEGTPITSWSGTVTLNPGRNSIRAVMKPVEPIVNYPATSGGVTIPFGKARFYRYSHNNFNMIWRTKMLIADTNGQGNIWMGVYNENWEPLETVITESKADGWAVFDFTGDETIVYIALAYIRSDGYPPKLSGLPVTLAIKDTYFVNPQIATDGSGTWSQPYSRAQFALNLNQVPNVAYILGQGNYTAIAISGGAWLLGGFDPTNWKKRTPRTSVFITTTTSPAITLNNSYDPIVLDGLTVRTDYPTGDATAVQYSGTMSLSIINCEILGATSQTITSTLNSIAINANPDSDGSINIFNSTVSGGSVTGTGNNNISLYAIQIQAPVALTVVRSTIDGGTIRSLQSTSRDYKLQTSAIAIYFDIDVYTDTIIAASLLWGGTIYSNKIPPSTQACIFGNYCNMVITSSIVSAGYVNFTEATGTVRMTALGNYYSTGNFASLIAAGSIIDAGYFETASSNAVAAGYEQKFTISATIAGSIFITSNNYASHGIIPTPVYLWSNVLQPGLVDCVFIGSIQEAYNSDLNGYTQVVGTSLTHLPYSAANLFVSYTRPTSFAQFLANTWKSTGALKGLQTTTLPVSWGLNNDLLSPYPFLLVDRENNVRPAQAYWTIGPYQN